MRLLLRVCHTSPHQSAHQLTCSAVGQEPTHFLHQQGGNLWVQGATSGPACQHLLQASMADALRQCLQHLLQGDRRLRPQCVDRRLRYDTCQQRHARLQVCDYLLGAQAACLWQLCRLCRSCSVCLELPSMCCCQLQQGNGLENSKDVVV